MKKHLVEITIGVCIISLCSGGGNRQALEISKEIREQIDYLYEYTTDFMQDTYRSWCARVLEGIDRSTEVVAREWTHRKEEARERIASYVIEWLAEEER